jgi:hypothetical protein
MRHLFSFQNYSGFSLLSFIYILQESASKIERKNIFLGFMSIMKTYLLFKLYTIQK